MKQLVALGLEEGAQKLTCHYFPKLQQTWGTEEDQQRRFKRRENFNRLSRAEEGLKKGDWGGGEDDVARIQVRLTDIWTFRGGWSCWKVQGKGEGGGRGVLVCGEVQGVLVGNRGQCGGCWRYRKSLLCENQVG